MQVAGGRHPRGIRHDYDARRDYFRQAEKRPSDTPRLGLRTLALHFSFSLQLRVFHVILTRALRRDEKNDRCDDLDDSVEANGIRARTRAAESYGECSVDTTKRLHSE